MRFNFFKLSELRQTIAKKKKRRWKGKKGKEKRIKFNCTNVYVLALNPVSGLLSFNVLFCLKKNRMLYYKFEASLFSVPVPVPVLMPANEENSFYF